MKEAAYARGYLLWVLNAIPVLALLPTRSETLASSRGMGGGESQRAVPGGLGAVSSRLQMVKTVERVHVERACRSTPTIGDAQLVRKYQ